METMIEKFTFRASRNPRSEEVTVWWEGPELPGRYAFALEGADLNVVPPEMAHDTMYRLELTVQEQENEDMPESRSGQQSFELPQRFTSVSIHHEAGEAPGSTVWPLIVPIEAEGGVTP